MGGAYRLDWVLKTDNILVGDKQWFSCLLTRKIVNSINTIFLMAISPQGIYGMEELLKIHFGAISLSYDLLINFAMPLLLSFLWTIAKIQFFIEIIYCVIHKYLDKKGAMENIMRESPLIMQIYYENHIYFRFHV